MALGEQALGFATRADDAKQERAGLVGRVAHRAAGHEGGRRPGLARDDLGNLGPGHGRRLLEVVDVNQGADGHEDRGEAEGVNQGDGLEELDDGHGLDSLTVDDKIHRDSLLPSIIPELL